MPANYTFTAADQGTHTFSGGATLFTAGAQTLTVQDTANSSLTASATVSVVAAPASQFVVAAPATVVPGTPFDITLAAVDPYGNVDMNYAGTVAWTTSDTDPGVVLAGQLCVPGHGPGDGDVSGRGYAHHAGQPDAHGHRYSERHHRQRDRRG